MNTLYGDYASLCLQTLERPDALVKCMTSLWEHTHYPYELLVHDDGSTHPSVQDWLLASWKSGLISALIYGNPPGYNTGTGVPLHRLFQCSHGRYVVKLDADLIFEDGWLEDAVRVMEAFPEVVWLGLVYWARFHDKSLIRKESRAGVDIELHWKAITTAFMVRRTALEPLGHLPEYSTSFSDDVTMCGAIFPGLCLCRTEERPPLEVLTKGWLATLPKGWNKVRPQSGSGTVVNVTVPSGATYHRPTHYHPHVVGDLKRFPISLARLGGHPYSRGLWGEGDVVPPLEELGTGEGRDFRISQEASTGNYD